MMKEPEILAFTCNWCSYAGADLAGTSRIQYPSNVKIVRVMCSGRVDPVFIFKAFEMGIDGVLVSGCHPGDCHYISGNLKAEKKVENAKKILDVLGLGSDRLRLEWISASEGEKFASVIRDFTEQLIKIGHNPLKRKSGRVIKNLKLMNAEENIYGVIERTNVMYCLDCGKCSSSCPITRMNPDYSPRMTIKRVLSEGSLEQLLSDEGIWACLTCGLCSERCPSDVKYPEFVHACRVEAHRLGLAKENYTRKGLIQSLQRIMGNSKLKQDRLKWLPNGVKFSKKGDILYFVGCLPYYNIIFEDLKINLLKTAESVIKILNSVGIRPVLLENERCCGHDLYYSGDMENFEKLAELNVNMIKKSGAKKVVTTCPECYRTLKLAYSEVLGEQDFEVVHISELLADLIEKGEIKFVKKIDRTVTYHDPCRLGRHMGIYEAPREVLVNIPGVKLVEMERNKENALCCGVSAWMNCGKYSRQIQIERLKEAKATGADLLVVSCPKCMIHFTCAMNDKLPVEKDEVTIEMEDLPVIVAESMNLI